MLYAAARKFLPRGGSIFFAMSGNVFIFAPTFESESCKQEKHCDILSLKVRQINEGGLSINCFRLNVYAVFI